MKPRLLDLFCGGGGAARGYQFAGFHVTGVDLAPQPNYVGDDFYQADALTFPLEGYDAIHASPPCQAYSTTAVLHDAVYPKLVEEVRAQLVKTGLPYVIENVMGAPLRNSVRLCGSSFGLGVRRHRLFETHPVLIGIPPCAHHLQPLPIDVTGTGGRGTKDNRHRKPRSLDEAREAMGIDWMTRPELSEAVPPAYSQFIGERLLAHLEVAA